MKNLMFMAIVILTNYAIAQENVTPKEDPCPCCEGHYNDFNFWLGEWRVYDKDGKQVGNNSIKKIQNGCAVSENWMGFSGLNGSSLNYFKKADSTWNQVWVDNKGYVLNFKGRLENGKMVLKSDLMKGNKINWYYNKITWSKNTDGTLTQRWETYDKNDKVQSLVFLGTYKR